MKNILLYLWQLPQNLLGLFIIKIIKAEYNKDYNFWYILRFNFGVSLGNYIIFGERFNGTDLKHERGHQKQSLYLGWLYLIVIGIPSAFGNLWDRIFHKDWPYEDSCIWYYSLPWEAWADELGGVRR